MAKKYSCKNCGAELYFDPKRGTMHCDYCGSDFDPAEYDFKPGEAEAEDSTIPQAAADEEVQSAGVGEQQTAAAGEGAQATDDSMSLEDLVVYKCPNCGAEVITSQKTVATTCVYCNRAITLTGNVKGEFRPDYVLPFEKDRSEVERAYRNLCSKSILTPRLFTKEAAIKKIKGMYIPYWLFSFEGQAALDIRGKNIRVFRTGDTEITETSNYAIREAGRGSFTRIPADALKEMDNLMMDSIEPFDFSKLKPFNPAYLTGFYTQRWDDTASENEPRAKSRAKKALSEEVARRAGTYTTSFIEQENYQWKEQKAESVMLPVWMMYTEYRGKNYIFGMNGQTGKMLGEIPKDSMKLVRIGVLVFILVQILLMLIRVVEVMV